jgi:hypothetical protein
MLADKGSDLNEIFGRLVQQRHSPAAIGDLLIAFQLTLADIHGASDFVYGKLYDIGDRLRALEKPKRGKAPARNGSKKKQAK